MRKAEKKDNVITIEFDDYFKVKTPALYQYDTGQQIKFENVPDNVEVQFSNEKSKETLNKIIQNQQVIIPDSLISEGLGIEAYIQYIDENSQTTKKKIIIPVIPRPMPGTIVPEPEEQTFRQQVEGIMQETKEIAESVRKDADSGKFNGQDYVITEEDKQEIIQEVKDSTAVYITEV